MTAYPHAVNTAIVWGVLAVTPCMSMPVESAIRPVELRCEYRVDPVGIDATRPRLSWRLVSDKRGARQTAYRILVASRRKILGQNEADLWDSGRVRSSDTIQLAYRGPRLQSRQECYWKVMVWDAAGQASKWSDVAAWTMGLLQTDDWAAQYISYRDVTPVFKDRESLFLPPARQYRRPFVVSNRVRRAVIYASALGIYELHLNGQRVGDARFAPGWTDYRKRAYYQTYDVTDRLQAGRNVIGAWVADGWYSGYVGFGLLTGIGTEKIGRYTYGKTPSLLVQLELDFEDGSRQVIGSNTSWKVSGDGPIREADMLMGEHYDARRELDGWASSDYDDSRWAPAMLAEQNGHPRATRYEFRNPERTGDHPKIKGRPVDLGFHAPRLEAFPGLPIRVVEEIRPVSITPRGEGTYVFDLGQNFAGVVRLKVKGKSGHRIQLRFGEMLYPDGRLMTENLRKARAQDFYVCRGDPAGEQYTPRFTIHGFQYVEVSNFPGQPAEDTITGLAIHSDTPLTSEFECSDPTINQLFRNVVWTQRANFVDLPTDCPQRDERMGWTGDAQVYVGTATYNADVSAFYSKWLRELMESQRPSGAFPGYAPFPFQHGWDFGTAWADAGVICPWTIWQAYGDTEVLRRCWEPMTRFMQWRSKTSKGQLGIVHGNVWGDWLAQGPSTPLDYIDSIYYAITLRMMSEMAGALGRERESQQYREQWDRVQHAFLKKYVKPDSSLTVHTQTAYALALFADLIPLEDRERMGQHLSQMISENGNHMSTGFLGTRPLLPVLSSVGQHDLATFLLQSHEFPSWGYEIDQGATTIWERWDSYTKEDGFGRHNAAMNSFAHYSFGAVCEWMFRTLAGISSIEPGYRKIAIAPHPPSPRSNGQHEPIRWVRARYQSIQGPISVEWHVGQRPNGSSDAQPAEEKTIRGSGDFHLSVSIPPNTLARVEIPAIDMDHVRLDGNPPPPADDRGPLRSVTFADNRMTVEIGSGTYQFTSYDAIKPAARPLVTSAPVDRSINPERVDLTDARELISWDFHNPRHVDRWTERNNLRFQRTGNKVVMVATGSDPQLATELDAPISGHLAIAVRGRPAKGVSAQFFWAGEDGRFTATRSTQRTFQDSTRVNTYLFGIEPGAPITKLRFDPFNNSGELEIESITIYRLAQ